MRILSGGFAACRFSRHSACARPSIAQRKQTAANCTKQIQHQSQQYTHKQHASNTTASTQNTTTVDCPKLKPSQPANQPRMQGKTQSINQPNKQSIHQASNHSISQPTNQSIKCHELFIESSILFCVFVFKQIVHSVIHSFIH